MINLFIRKALWCIVPAFLLILTLELSLRFAGARPFPYAGIDSATFWVESTDGTAPGFVRVRPRPFKLAKDPNPVFLKEKPSNGFRIFCLGDSPIYGWPFEVGGCVDWLQSHYSAMMPERTVEVVTASNPGWHATETRQLLRECTEHSPDLLLWMAGDSEYTPENVDLAKGENTFAPATLARNFILSLSLTSQLGRWVPSLAHQRAFLAQVPADQANLINDPALPKIQERFRRALEGGIADARAANIPIVLCTPPRNFRAMAPRSSVFSESVKNDATAIATWNRHMGAATSAMERSDWNGALQNLKNAAAIDSLPASLQYNFGRAYESLNNKSEAAKHYRNAIENDGSPSRPREWVYDIIKSVAAQTGTPLIDAEAHLNQKSPCGLAGNELMLDGLHPNYQGHELLGSLFANEMAAIFHLPVNRALDVNDLIGPRGKELARSKHYNSLRYQCVSKVYTVIEKSPSDAAFKAARSAGAQAAALVQEDDELNAACAILDGAAGAVKRAQRELLKAAQRNESVAIELVVKYSTNTTYKRILDSIDFPFEEFEARLPEEQKRVIRNRVDRALRAQK